MKTFTVGIKEVHTNWVNVEAKTPEEAILKAREGEFEDHDNLTYSHTLDPEKWDVTEAA